MGEYRQEISLREYEPMPDYSLSRFYTEREVAHILNCSLKTVTRSRRRGLIEFVRMSSQCIRIRGQQLRAFIERQTQSVPSTGAVSEESRTDVRRADAEESKALARIVRANPNVDDSAKEAFLRAYTSCDLDDIELPQVQRRKRTSR
jgi:hypothetical protein